MLEDLSYKVQRTLKIYHERNQKSPYFPPKLNVLLTDPLNALTSTEKTYIKVEHHYIDLRYDDLRRKINEVNDNNGSSLKVEHEHFNILTLS